MVRTRGNRGQGASSQGPPTSALPPPSPELALILRSLEPINETLNGHQSTDVEVEPPTYGVGNPKASRDSKGGPPPGDVTRELEKIIYSQSLLGAVQVNVQRHGWKE
jgi:hypothetical protein